jgi:hypothetical protein
MSDKPIETVEANALAGRPLRYFDFVMAAFVAILLLSNVIGAAKPAQVWGFTFGAGILFFPLSYVIGDVLTEVYGYARARRVIWSVLVSVRSRQLSRRRGPLCREAREVEQASTAKAKMPRQPVNATLLPEVRCHPRSRSFHLLIRDSYRPCSGTKSTGAVAKPREEASEWLSRWRDRTGRFRGLKLACWRTRQET